MLTLFRNELSEEVCASFGVIYFILVLVSAYLLIIRYCIFNFIVINKAKLKQVFYKWSTTIFMLS